MEIISIVLELAFIFVYYIGKCTGAPTFPRNPCFEDSALPSSKCVSFIAQCRNWTWNETLSNFATASQLLKENRFPLYSNGNGLLSRAVACLAVPNLMPDDGTCAECGRYCANKISTENKFCSLYCPLPPPSPPTRPWWLWRWLSTASYARALQTGTGKLFNTTRNNHIRGIERATASPKRKEATKFAKLVNLLNCIRFEISNRIHTDNRLFYKFILVIFVIGCVCVALGCIGYALKQCL